MSWARFHAEATGHSTFESLDDPGSCADCDEKSPGYRLGRTSPALGPAETCLIWLNEDRYCGKPAVKLNVWGSPVCVTHSGDQEWGQM